MAVAISGDGQVSSPTHRPGRSAWWPAGATGSCIHARSIGSSMTPVAASLSQWSHQRRHSWRKPIAGPGSPSCGNACDHGPIRPLRGPGQTLEQPRDRVGVAVGPAADRVDGDLDPRVVLADRAVAPVVVAALVGEPRLDEGGRPLHALEPGLAPPVADGRRVGRLGEEREHRRRPREHVEREDAAADVVHVVGVAVVARAHRDDRAERRRAARGDLQAVEAAPRDPEHADAAGAPRLRREPRDDLERVVLLLSGVLVAQDAVGVAAAAQVDPDGGVAVAREVGVVARVAAGHRVALAIGQELEERGDGVALGVVRQPDPRGETGTVRQRDPRVIDAPDAARELGPEPQGCSSRAGPGDAMRARDTAAAGAPIIGAIAIEVTQEAPEPRPVDSGHRHAVEGVHGDPADVHERHAHSRARRRVRALPRHGPRRRARPPPPPDRRRRARRGLGVRARGPEPGRRDREPRARGARRTGARGRRRRGRGSGTGARCPSPTAAGSCALPPAPSASACSRWRRSSRSRPASPASSRSPRSRRPST